MAGKFHHEEIYRGAGAARRLAEPLVVLCGAGALGSNLADNLTRQGLRRLRAIDRDRVEEHNVGTQVYGEGDVGAWKVEVLRNRLFRSVGVEIEARREELGPGNAGKLLEGADIVVDAFDNSASRALVKEGAARLGIPCLHAGVAADYGEVVWDPAYRVPGDAGADVCDYPLARNLVLLVVAVASEAIVESILGGARRSWSVTLRDLSVRPLEPGR